MTTRNEVLREADMHRVGIDGFLIDPSEDGTAASASLVSSNIDFVEQVERARVWIRRFTLRRTINRSMTSRLIAVKAARETGGPISQGCFIIACLLEHVAIRQVTAEIPEAYTTLSFKSPANLAHPVGTTI